MEEYSKPHRILRVTARPTGHNLNMYQSFLLEILFEFRQRDEGSAAHVERHQQEAWIRIYFLRGL